MAAWRDGIDIKTEIAFADDPLAASPTYTDVSAYVRGIPRIFHGKNSEEGSIAPSTMTLILSNRDRRFDPDYASGPYFGNLVPMKKIRVTATLGVFSAVVFTGFVAGWQQGWQNRADGTVEIQARSGFQYLANEALPASAYSGEVMADAPDFYWPIQGGDLSARAGTDLGRADVNGGPLTFATISDGSYPVGESSYLYGQGQDMVWKSTTPSDLPEAIEAWVYLTGTDAVELRLRVQISTTTWMSLQVANNGTVGWGYSHASDNVAAGNDNAASFALGLGAGAHHLAVFRDGSDLNLSIDGTVRTLSLSAGTINATGTVRAGYWAYWLSNSDGPGLAHYAIYDTGPSADRFHTHYQAGRYAWSGSHGIYGRELSGARLNRILDDAGWPTADRDIDTGHSDTGPYLPASRDPLSMMREVELAECGLLYFDPEGQIAFRSRSYFWTDADTGTIFSDDGASTAVKYAELHPDGNSVETIRNIVTTNYGTAGTAATRRDQTSVDSYTASDQTDSCPTITDRQTALNRSAYILREKKDPQTRITRLVVHLRHPTAARTATQVEKVLALQLGQVITVEYTPMGVGSQVVKKAQVLGIEHEVSMGQQRQWTTTLYLSPAPKSNTEAPYWTLGDATYGKIGAAFGNKIPY